MAKSICILADKKPFPLVRYLPTGGFSEVFILHAKWWYFSSLSFPLVFKNPKYTDIQRVRPETAGWIWLWTLKIVQIFVCEWNLETKTWQKPLAWEFCIREWRRNFLKDSKKKKGIRALCVYTCVFYPCEHLKETSCGKPRQMEIIFVKLPDVLLRIEFRPSTEHASPGLNWLQEAGEWDRSLFWREMIKWLLLPLTSFSQNINLKEKRPRKVDDFSYLHRIDWFY